jgi:foldase protein PrsA
MPSLAGLFYAADRAGRVEPAGARRPSTAVALIALALLTGLALVVVGCGGTPQPPPAAEPNNPPATTPPTEAAEVPASAPAESVATGSSTGGPTQDGRPLIARVNDQPVFMDTYQKQVEQTEKALTEQGIMAQGTDGEAQRAQVRENVLQGLIDQAIIEQAATRMGITVTPEELEQSLQSLVGEGQGSLEEWLAANSMTMDDLRAMQRAQLVAGKVIAAISAVVPASAEQVHARHIFTLDVAKAQALRERLAAGENFAALAQQESDDPSTAANGGDLGWFPKDAPMIPPALVQAAFSLQVGQISDPVQSEAGYHVIKVDAREPSRPLTPEMLLYAQQSAFEKWLAEQRGQARIERYQAQ